MFCGQCGEPIVDGSLVCPRCGAPIPAGSGSAARPLGPGSSAPARGLLKRAWNVVVAPASEWPLIASEPGSTGGLYLRYVAPLAAIGAVAALVGHTFLDVRLLGPAAWAVALVQAAVSYALSFLGVFVVALAVDLLAPGFGGRRDALAALKVTVYSFTPGWIAGILNVVPALGVLAILAGLYGLYLLYLGLPVLMRCPADRSAGYAVAATLCAIVTWAVIAALGTCAGEGLGRLGDEAVRRVMG
jgi:hypothetical protein